MAILLYNVGPPRSLSWFITTITMVYGSYNHTYILRWAFTKPTFTFHVNRQGPHIALVGRALAPRQSILRLWLHPLTQWDIGVSCQATLDGTPSGCVNIAMGKWKEHQGKMVVKWDFFLLISWDLRWSSVGKRVLGLFFRKMREKHGKSWLKWCVYDALWWVIFCFIA